ncbi:MAG: dihydroorotate dehydrogenase electron transfer subunit [Desulfuromonadaceae bacterium]|nr:dihydroorotate dehydrogenase electron transfer subunit [Geobacteraceae bacterium]
MKDIRTSVLYNRKMAPGYYCLGIAAPDYPALAQAGQFVMLRITQGYDPLLRRPFGIFRTGVLEGANPQLPAQDYMEVVYKVVGHGTRLMTHLNPGDEVSLLGPLGEGFRLGSSTHAAPQDALLVGGGIGVVPLFMLAQRLVEQGSRVRLLLGGRSCTDILAVTEFERLGVETYVATDDGTLGEEGLVTRVLERKLHKYPYACVFACGPMPMLNAVEHICTQAQAPLQVSLEALMACGVGACLGCVVKGREHSTHHPDYLCTCKQGPVFDARELSWPDRTGSTVEEQK